MGEKRQRVYVIDTIRGIIIIGVVVYHFLFDLYDMFGENLWWMDSAFANAIRDLGAGMLIFLSGISCLLSRSNLKRGIKTAICAGLLTGVTYLIIPDNLIVWGILHFFAFAMLLYAFLGKYINKVPRIVGAVVCLALFVVTYHIIDYPAYIGISGIARFDIPYEWKANIWTFILGVGGPFFSADYFPIMPWIFVFLAGTFVGNYVKEGRIPQWLYKDYCKPVTYLGNKTLIIYLLHQPIVYGILLLVYHFR